MLLEELLALWTKNYVMHSQRVAHAKAMGHPAPDEPAVQEIPAPQDERGLTLATHHGPRIELF